MSFLCSVQVCSSCFYRQSVNASPSLSSSYWSTGITSTASSALWPYPFTGCWYVGKLKKLDVSMPVRMHLALDNENEPAWVEVKNLKDIVGGVSPTSQVS